MDEFKNNKNLIVNILRQFNLNFDFDISLLKKNWTDIVGENLANYTSPMKIYKNVLLVNCIHQGLIQTLQYHKDSIQKKIQELYPNKVKDIKFSFGKIN